MGVCSDQSCKHEGKIQMLDQRDQMIQESLSELKSKTDLILMQITKVAVLEVNHVHQTEALSRAFKRIDDLEGQITALTANTNAFINRVDGMARMAKFLWVMMGGGLGAMLLKVLFGGTT